jgi:hypothetical protein
VPALSWGRQPGVRDVREVPDGVETELQDVEPDMSMEGATIPIVEEEWLVFKTKVFDRMVKAMGPPAPPPFFTEMLHNAFYAGALSLFALEQKLDDAHWKALAGQIEAYYRAAVEHASRARPPV